MKALTLLLFILVLAGCAGTSRKETKETPGCELRDQLFHDPEMNLVPVDRPWLLLFCALALALMIFAIYRWSR